jgi:serine/threonine protein kinase
MQYVSGGTLQETLRQMEFHGTRSWNGSKLLDVLDSLLTRQGVEPPVGTEQRQRLGAYDWSSAVCLLGSQIASALDYAHRQGVLHRDLKPANILLNESARPLLVDFNVSSCSKLDGASPAAYFGGSLAYMSPEQLEACNPRHPRAPESLDGRSDIYALGIVLWELLTSQRPFQDHQLAEGWPATVEAMTARRLAGLQDSHWSQLPSHVPHCLQSILRRCLAPAPEDRYSTAGQLAAHLRRCLHPEAERVFAPPRGWRALTARWPMLAMVLTLLIPNALAGIFNFAYNHSAIIQKTPASKPIFESVATFINMTAFPLGVAIGVGLVLPIAREVSQRYRHATSTASSRGLRRRCLELGNRLSRLSLALWLIAGIAYPIAFWWQDAPLTHYHYVHFFGSLALCGMIVACYPFFGAFSIIVEVWYPLLCGDGAVPREDVPHLSQLKRTSWRYLLTAVLVPMLSTTIIMALNDADTRPLLIGFSIGSLVCFAVAFLLAQRLQGDLTILEEDAGE